MEAIGFAAATVGEDPPSGWTKRWDAAANPANYVRLARYDAPVYKRFEVFCTQATTGFGPISTGSATDVDVVAAHRIVTASVTTGLALIIARGSGASGSENGYYAGYSLINGQMRISKVVAGAITDLALSASALGFSAGTTNLLRFHVEGTSLKLRGWAAGTEEPTTWDVETTDSAIATSGWVGLWNYYNTGSTAWNFISIDDSSALDAPVPLLNDAYSDWLARQDVMRCVLAEMSTRIGEAGSPEVEGDGMTYVANMAYTSRSWDDPASTGYLEAMAKAPSFSHQMNEALRGEASVGLGAFEIDNSSGARDNWLRMKWEGRVVRILLGDPSWPRHDFRTVILGSLRQPLAPSIDRIVFPITDLSDMLNVNLQDNVIGAGGEFENRPKPLLLGVARFIDPVPIDTSTLEYQIHDGAMVAFTNALPWPVYDNFVEIKTAANTISSVSPAIDTIVATSAHGLLANWRVRFSSGTPPAPLALDTDYWVIATGLTTTQFRLSATRGGSQINITGSDTGAGFTGWGYDWNASTGIIQLASAPAGRVVVGVAVQSAATTIGSIVGWILSTKLGINANYIDQAALDALDTALPYNCGMWIPADRRVARDVIGELLTRMRCWSGWTPDGLFTCGLIKRALPTYEMLLQADDIDGMSLDKSVLSSTVEAGAFTYQPRNYTLGVPQSQGDEFSVLHKALDYAMSPPGSNFDASNLNLRRSAEAPTLDSIVDEESDALIMQASLSVLVSRALATHTIRTRLPASESSIGDTIAIEHDRFQWKVWAAGEESDYGSAGAQADARLAVVLGKSVDLAEPGPFKVTLKVLRIVAGYWPGAGTLT